METYVDGSGLTLHERPDDFIGVVVGFLAGAGALVAIGGWSIQRLRSRRVAAGEAQTS